MKKLFAALVLAFALPLVAQTTNTQYQHISYTWNAGPTLNICSTTVTSSCVKDYLINITAPGSTTSKVITLAYPASSYLYGPGGFLFCGTWSATLVIEYINDKSAALTTTPVSTTTIIDCPFVVSPPSGFQSTPQS